MTAYFTGLFAAERSKRNIERMSEKTKSDYQSQQHFITDSPWSASDVMEIVGRKLQKRLGSVEGQAYAIDESSNRKSGKHSVGVSSQYNGNLGKVENSQTGVYASLSKGNRVGLINARLFLPDEWVEDSGRCKKAGIPAKDIVKKTKIELALEMISEDKSRGIQFGWVNADALYGNSSSFCNNIEEMGENFVVDIHRDKQIYLNDPAPYVPERISKKGRKPSQKVTDEPVIEAQKYCQRLTNKEFSKVKIRKGTKGWIKGSVHIKRIWVWDDKEEQGRERTLIIRKAQGKQAAKYAISNFSISEKSPQEFAFMQSQRFWIERAFQDCKGELGMADYQVRKYRAWYHHQALFMMAYDYVNYTKERQKKQLPLLSARDVRLLIIAYLAQSNVVMEKEISDLIIRHKQRITDIMRYYPPDDLFKVTK